MSDTANTLKKSFDTLNNNLISFVENCPAGDWEKVSPGETWPVGLVARHVADGHYSLLAFLQIIVAGGELPEMSMDAIDAMNEKHAADHSGCKKDEVLGMLKENGGKISSYIAGLSEDDLNRTAYFSLAGGDISAAQVVENVLISGCTEHLENMKTTVV
jgi:hypothetical protein